MSDPSLPLVELMNNHQSRIRLRKKYDLVACGVFEHNWS